MALPPARTMEQILEHSVEPRRFEMYLTITFAAAALLLVSLGIYGVVSFTVARRTPEIGVRMAIGAGRLDITKMIVAEGLMPVLGGLAAGLAASAFLGTLISSQLYGVAPRDPWIMSAVAMVLILVALCACLLPARRAMKIDPVSALRFE